MSLSKKIRSFLYSAKDLRKMDEICSAKKTANSPIITLTTVPKRIENIKPTIYSLLAQDLKPKLIILNLSYDLFPRVQVPKELFELKNLKINMVEKDFGPATKFFYTLRESPPEERVIVVDDDMYYSNDLTSTLVLCSEQSPDAAFCVNGLRLSKTMRASDRESDKEIRSGRKRVAIIEGCGGYLVKPRFFSDNLLFDFSLPGAPERARFDDDFWISGHLSRSGIEKYQVALKKKRKSLINTIESAISGDRAKLQQQMIDFFSDDWTASEFFD